MGPLIREINAGGPESICLRFQHHLNQSGETKQTLLVSPIRVEPTSASLFRNAVRPNHFAEVISWKAIAVYGAQSAVSLE